MDYGIRGRVAVVTGADSGIGLATVRLLLGEGVRVVMSDIDPAALERARAGLVGAGLAGAGEIAAIAADLSQLDAVAALRSRTETQFGPADILVHAAGITGVTGLFHEIDDDSWHSSIDIDLMAAVRVCRAFLPDMREARWGRIVLIASEDAVQPYPDEMPYCAAKAAVLNLAKGLSKTYAGEGVLVNSVSPAFIRTPMTDTMMGKRARKNGTSIETAVASFLKEERPTLDLSRRGEPEEVAAAIAFLCSAQASFITGANLRVDGGSVATMST